MGAIDADPSHIGQCLPSAGSSLPGAISVGLDGVSRPKLLGRVLLGAGPGHELVGNRRRHRRSILRAKSIGQLWTTGRSVVEAGAQSVSLPPGGLADAGGGVNMGSPNPITRSLKKCLWAPNRLVGLAAQTEKAYLTRIELRPNDLASPRDASD